MTFQRIVIALLVLIVAGLGAIGYFEWKMAVQVRTLKAFVEGSVFNEAVMACEHAKSSTPFKWNGGKSTSVIGLNSVKTDKYSVYANYTLVKEGARVLGDGVPKIGAHGKPVLFLHPKDFSGALVEIEQS